MRKIVAGVLGALLTLVAGACTADEESNPHSGGSGPVVLILKENSPGYWTKVSEGAQAAAEELKVEINVQGPESSEDGKKQLDLLQTALKDKPLGIGFAPQDGAQSGADEILDQARHDRIPVVAFETSVVGSTVPVATVTSDDGAMGAQAAQRLVEAAGDTGTVAILTSSEVGAAAARRDGFTDYLQSHAPEVQVVEVAVAVGDEAAIRAQVKAVLEANPGLNGFFGTDDKMTQAIAVEAAERAAAVKIVGIGGTAEIVSLIKEGMLVGSIVPNSYAMGYQTVKTLVESAQGAAPSDPRIHTEAVWINKDNLDSDEVKRIIG